MKITSCCKCKKKPQRLYGGATVLQSRNKTNNAFKSTTQISKTKKNPYPHKKT